MKLTVLLLISSIICHNVQTTPLPNHRESRQVIDAGGASTLAVDSMGTPVMTTAVDALGGVTLAGAGVMGNPMDPLGLGFGVNNLMTPGIGYGTGLGMGTNVVSDTSGLGLGVRLTATMGEAVGNIFQLINSYRFTPVDMMNSFFVLPPNLQAYIPDDLFLIESPPTYDNYILACDIRGTGMCYYYYYPNV